LTEKEIKEILPLGGGGTDAPEGKTEKKKR